MNQPSFLSKINNRYGLSKYFTLYLLLGISTLVTSCKKDDDKVTPEATLSDKLSSTKWISSTVDAVVDGKTYTSTTDIGTTETTFKSDGSYNEYNQKTKETTIGTWKLNGSALTVTFEDVVLKGEVSDVTGSSMTFTMPEVNMKTIDLENFQDTYSDITGTDPKFMDIFQLALLLGLDYSGFDQKKLTAQSKFHIIYKFKN